MKENLSFLRGCALSILSLLLGFCLTLSSVLYQRESDPACDGNLSAGFPLPFLCDSTGGSPISGWNRIDLSDFWSTNWPSLLLDLFLYSSLSLLAWIIIRGLTRAGWPRMEDFKWGVLLCIGYLLAFLFTFLATQASHLDFKEPLPTTPTPIIYTPTPFGTPPPPESSPIPTVQP